MHDDEVDNINFFKINNPNKLFDIEVNGFKNRNLFACMICSNKHLNLKSKNVI